MYGGQRYPITKSFVIIGSKTAAGVRTGIELESTYSTTETTEPTKIFETGGYTKLVLDSIYTMGASETTNSIEIKVEGSPDRTNWYRIANDSTTTDTSTLTQREFTFVGSDGAAATIQIFLDIAYKYVRVSCKETGVVTNKGNVFVEATLVGA